MKKLYLIILVMLFLTSCYRLLTSSGGGQSVKADTHRLINTSDIALPEGYQIEAVAEGLTFPTGITFDESGTPFVTESGYSYGEVFLEPKLLKINPDRTSETVASGEKNGPWNGVTYHNGFFYISEGGQLEGGKILKVSKDGIKTPLIENLPSLGDHHTNGPVVKGNFIYFGQGVATNSSIVGKDNYKFGWLKRFPDFHDIPCYDIKLKGVNYVTENFLNPDSKSKVYTGSYLSYGTPANEGQIIKGKIPCSGAVMRISENGGDPELVAWGFRNPYGLAFNEGELFVTDNGYDVRGSRPLWGTGDYLWKVEQGKWYGWPDYSGGSAVNSTHFNPPGKDVPQKVLLEDPNKVPIYAALLGVHSSSNGFDFSTSSDFGFKGEAFIAQFGDMAPGVGKVLNPVGYKVVRVNTETGVIITFAVNKKNNAPASKLNTGGIERPVAVRFSPDGKTLYIVDFGVLMTSEQGATPLKKTGVIWKIYKK